MRFLAFSRVICGVLLLGSSFVANGQVRVVEVPAAPFRLLQATHDRAADRLIFTLQNVSKGVITQAVVSGKAFSGAGVREGVFLATATLHVEPGQQAEIVQSTKGLAVQEGDVLLVVAREATIDEAGRASSWRLDRQSYLALTPGTADVPLASVHRPLPGPGPMEPIGCCDACSGEAVGCGFNFLRGGCRTSACVSSFSCNTSTDRNGGQTCSCSVSCKSPDFCC